MAIESNLPPRYEIRVLGPEHIEWASAIVIHSNLYHSPIWPAVYPNDRAARVYKAFNSIYYLVRHQVESGYSLGIFDKEYQFRRPESAATGGQLYWDQKDLEASGEKLLEQMDFPLVSVALAYDGINPLDHDKMKGLMESLPMLGTAYALLERLDSREKSSWEAQKPREVLHRNATSTRHEYEGKGLMRKLANYMMRTAAAEGFRGIQIEPLSDAVAHVWANPPAPFTAEVVSTFHMASWEEENEKGEKYNPFYPASQRVSKIYTTLKAT
ncbi:hypothetical protein HIM_05206 [Hirsutella minnesotensis 3608]|uniref:N-acetyltransferase domain-containing protein n=1 Tax=Hirsutella minnesotensis 3608 TaxID=1043627 RepID=A0A0F7ZPC9_9HYPO|nr:hypothetical protein HIM_05206 [Hirsutella minnesotensis 3608]